MRIYLFKNSMRISIFYLLMKVLFNLMMLSDEEKILKCEQLTFN